MAIKWIPEGYHVVTPYHVVPRAAEFIEFLKEAFGALERERFGNPDGKIMHAEVSIGDSVIMLGDASAEFEATRSSTHPT
jgi:PhnB protein